MSRARGWSSVALVGLAAFCLTPSPVSAAARVTAQDVAGLRIVEQTRVENAGIRILALSPDGRWLFGTGADEVCAVETADPTTTSCAPFPQDVEEWTVAWSPNGSRVAFTESSVVALRDSDLWVFDPAAGTLTNLTDDGYDGSVLGLGDEAPNPVIADTNPAWSPDGQTLAFARSEISVREEKDVPFTTRLYRIPAAGGEPDYVAQVSSAPFATFFGVRWLPDGQRLAVVVDNPDQDSPFNGLWVVVVATGATEPVARADPDQGPGQLLAVSPRGEALVFYVQLVGRSGASGPRFALVDLESGRTRPLAAPRDDPAARITLVALSPDGSRAILTVGTTDRLIVRDLATGEEIDLLAGLPAEERPDAVGIRLDWAENDLVYVGSSFFAGSLLQLGSE